MQQVMRLIAPATGAHHPRQSTGCPKRSGASNATGVESKAADCAPRIKRLSAASDTERRGPSSATLVGEAGASLVLSRLQSWGYPAHPAMAGLAYDLIVEVTDLDDILRLQVKTRTEPNGRRCTFKMQRGYRRSRTGVFRYAADDFELSAFVCLSLSRVFFYAGPVERISVKTDWLRMPGVERETFDLALKVLRHRRNAEALACLAALDTDGAEPVVLHGESRASAVQTELDLGARG